MSVLFKALQKAARLHARRGKPDADPRRRQDGHAPQDPAYERYDQGGETYDPAFYQKTPPQEGPQDHEHVPRDTGYPEPPDYAGQDYAGQEHGPPPEGAYDGVYEPPQDQGYGYDQGGYEGTEGYYEGAGESYDGANFDAVPPSTRRKPRSRLSAFFAAFARLIPRRRRKASAQDGYDGSTFDASYPPSRSGRLRGGAALAALLTPRRGRPGVMRRLTRTLLAVLLLAVGTGTAALYMYGDEIREIIAFAVMDDPPAVRRDLGAWEDDALDRDPFALPALADELAFRHIAREREEPAFVEDESGQELDDEAFHALAGLPTLMPREDDEPPPSFFDDERPLSILPGALRTDTRRQEELAARPPEPEDPFERAAARLRIESEARALSPPVSIDHARSVPRRTQDRVQVRAAPRAAEDAVNAGYNALVRGDLHSALRHY